jgi:hypothetical protein
MQCTKTAEKEIALFNSWRAALFPLLRSILSGAGIFFRGLNVGRHFKRQRGWLFFTGQLFQPDFFISHSNRFGLEKRIIYADPFPK